jgi:hypothetical protein
MIDASLATSILPIPPLAPLPTSNPSPASTLFARAGHLPQPPTPSGVYQITGAPPC